MPTLIRLLTPDGLTDPHLTADSLTDAARHDPPDGVYTIANTFEGTKTLRFDAHLDRLADSARRAGVPLWLDRPAVRAALRSMISEAGFGDVRYKISAGRALGEALLLAIEPFKPLPASVYDAGVHVITAPGSARHDPAAKTTSWILDRRVIEDALPAGVFTALLVGDEGELLEGLSSNFYAVLNGELRTAGEGVLAGIAQQIVFAVAQDVIPVRRDPVRLADVSSLSEAFITSASRGIVPVVSIDDVPIGEGVPGGVTRALIARYRAYVAENLVEL
jgi:branched-chain amino acid aminotransferase